jgi:hypothetical protein
VRFTVPQYNNSTFLVASHDPIDLDPAALVEHFRSARDGFSDEQADRLEAFLAGVEAECLADGGPVPPVADDEINVDLRPRDEYFLNNPEGVPERPSSCD